MALLTSIMVGQLLSPASAEATPPTIWVTSPAPGTIARGVVTIGATAASTSPSTLAWFGISIAGAPSGYNVQMNGTYSSYTDRAFPKMGIAKFAWRATGMLGGYGSSVSFTVDTTSWPLGSYQVTLYTEDSAGLAGMSGVFVFTAANGGPKLTISSPSSGASVSGIVNVAATSVVTSPATLQYAGISVVGLPSFVATLNQASPTLQNKAFGTSGTASYAWPTTSSTYQFTLDTTAWNQGSYQVQVFTQDSLGRTEVTSTTIVANNSGPSVSITSPSSGSTARGLLILTARGSTDSNGTGALAFAGITISGAMSSYTVALNGAGALYMNKQFGTAGVASYAWQTSASNYNFTLDTTPWTNGTYRITVYTQDVYGRSSASSALTVYTNNGNPTVAITGPSSGSRVNGTFSLTANMTTDPTGTSIPAYVGVSVNGVSGYSVSMNNTGYNFTSRAFGTLGTAAYAWQTGSPTYQFAIDSTRWPGGTYQVTVYTQDSNGRVASASINVLISREITVDLGVAGVNASGDPLVNIYVGGTTSLYSATTIFESAPSENGPWSQVSTEVGGETDRQVVWHGGLGKWMRVRITGAPELLPAISDPAQMIVRPSLTCTMPRTAKRNARVNGSCTADTVLLGAKVTLEWNLTGSWSSIGTIPMKKKTFPIHIVGAQAGNIKVRVVSDGIEGKFLPFNSNTLVVKVS